MLVAALCEALKMSRKPVMTPREVILSQLMLGTGGYGNACALYPDACAAGRPGTHCSNSRQ